MTTQNKRLYNSKRWRKARSRFLSEHPLCVMCAAIGRDNAADTVDHITPHKGDLELFWNPDNWQALCSHCHSRYKQQQEQSGIATGCDTDGNPIDASHYWNR